MQSQFLPNTYIAVDLETTGLKPTAARILEIGAWKVIDGEITEKFCSFVNPQMEIPEKIQQLTGISNEMVKDAPLISEVLPQFVEFCGDMDLLGHNIFFDYSFLKQQAVKYKIPFEKNGIDTLRIARTLLPELESRTLSALCTYFEIDLAQAHRAYHDAFATHHLYEKLKERATSENRDSFLPKPLLYKAKKEGPITDFQKVYLNDLVKYHRIELDVIVESLSRSEASRTIDKIIGEYGRIRR